LIKSGAREISKSYNFLTDLRAAWIFDPESNSSSDLYEKIVSLPSLGLVGIFPIEFFNFDFFSDEHGKRNYKKI